MGPSWNDKKPARRVTAGDDFGDRFGWFRRVVTADTQNTQPYQLKCQKWLHASRGVRTNSSRLSQFCKIGERRGRWPAVYRPLLTKAGAIREGRVGPVECVCLVSLTNGPEICVRWEACVHVRSSRSFSLFGLPLHKVFECYTRHRHLERLKVSPASLKNSEH